MLQSKTQHYKDGLVKVYAVSNSAEAGEVPVEALTLTYSLRYDERTVGINRFYSGLQSNIKVATLLRCPLLRDVTTEYIAIPNDGKQYKIVQIQVPQDVEPPSMDLTLERVVTDYAIG